MEILGRKACTMKNGRKKEEKLAENRVQDAKEVGHLAQNEVKEGENCTGNKVGVKAKRTQEESLKRTSRSVKNEPNLVILSDDEVQSSEATEMVLPIEEKDGKSVSLRTTRSFRKDGNLESWGGANNRRARGRGGKRNLGMETLTENGEGAHMEDEEKVEENLDSEIEVLEEVKEVFQEEGKGLDGLAEEGVRSAAECCEGLAGTSGFEQNDGDEVDLEKLTLGEWFDDLEVHLSKQIIDATEAMILDMRRKAEKFHEFMLPQNSKIKT